MSTFSSISSRLIDGASGTSIAIHRSRAQLPSSRAAARREGADRYFTGKKCRRGHLAERYTSTANCSVCAVAYSRRMRNEASEEQLRRWRRSGSLRRKYGLTVEQVDEMEAQQKSRCAVCLEEFSETPFVDHCHKTGAVRSLLCRGCNTAIGHAQENPQLLRALADYLEWHSRRIAS